MREYVRVRPGDEEAFIKKAEDLGYDELVLVYEKKVEKKLFASKMKIFYGLIGEKGFDENIQLGTSSEVLRKGATSIIDNEYENKGDFAHQRRSGLNHVVLARCKEKNVRILFDYGLLQGKKNYKQQQLLGRIKQNLLLCKKMKVPYSFVSFARQTSQMRAAKDVKALERVLS